MAYYKKGAYGKIYKLEDGNLEKQTFLYKNPNMYIKTPQGDIYTFIDTNILECIVLKRFSKLNLDIFPKIEDIIIDKNIIKIKQQNCGINLVDWVLKTPFQDRIKLLPHILQQISKILLTLKHYKIVHCDIKPSNICIDEYNNLYLIDFGFSTFVNAVSKGTPGTRFFCDPRYFNNTNIPIDFYYDTFSMCMVIYFIIYKNYLHYKEFSECYNHYKKTNEDILEEKILLFDVIHNLVPDKILNLIKRMVSLDINKRITPEELYNELNIEPLIFPIEEKNTVEQIIKEIKTYPQYKECVKNIYIICNNEPNKLNRRYSFLYTLIILNKLNHILKNFDKKLINKITIGILILSDLLQDFRIEIDYYEKISNIPKSELGLILIVVLELINFDIYSYIEEIENNEKITDEIYLNIYNYLYNIDG